MAFPAFENDRFRRHLVLEGRSCHSSPTCCAAHLLQKENLQLVSISHGEKVKVS